MNPYEAPESESTEADLPKGKTKKCRSCGSQNIYAPDMFSRPKINILFLLFGGWIYLLGRYAFETFTDECEDCGAVHKYKTIGSYIAMVFFILVVSLFVLGLLSNLLS